MKRQRGFDKICNIFKTFYTLHITDLYIISTILHTWAFLYINIYAICIYLIQKQLILSVEKNIVYKSAIKVK